MAIGQEEIGREVIQRRLLPFLREVGRHPECREVQEDLLPKHHELGRGEGVVLRADSR